MRAGFRDAGGRHREITVRLKELDDVLAAGMTVMIPDLPAHYPELAAFTRRLRTALLIPDNIGVDCFISAPTRGYGLHFDPRR